MKKNILFLAGGRSDEHEISLISTKCVLDALDRQRFKPLIVGISRQGTWYWQTENFFEGEFRADKIRLKLDAPEISLAPYPVGKHQGCIRTQNNEFTFDAVFPILHGPFGEDGTLQGLLEIMSVPYVGSNCGSSWICMDKVLTKQLCVSAGIPVVDFVWFNGKKGFDNKKEAIRKLGFPLFVKPSRLGSSVGISKVTSEDALLAAVETALKHDPKCLIEKGISGREIECAVLGLNQQAKASVPGEIVPSQKVGWYSYEAKYLLEDGAEVVVPAALAPETRDRIQDMAINVFNLLECDGMARVDMFLEKNTGRVFLNEVNTIPGFTPISMYPKMWQASGLNYSELITRLIELAFLKANLPIT